MVDVNYIVKKGHTAKLCLDNYDAAALVKMGPSEEKKREQITEAQRTHGLTP